MGLERGFFFVTITRAATNELVHRQTFASTNWLDHAATVVVVSKAGGYPDVYRVRARDCPVASHLPPDEWLDVTVWDES